MKPVQSNDIQRLGAITLVALGLAACGSDQPSDSRPISVSIDTNKARAPIGSPIEIAYQFEIGNDSTPIEKDYRVFVHFLDSHNALLFNDDHDPPEPTSSWKAGENVAYEAMYGILPVTPMPEATAAMFCSATPISK